MRLRVTCRHCGTAFAVSDRHAGKVGRCPAEGCGAKVKIPAAAAAPAEPAAAVSPRRRRPASKAATPWPLIGGGLAALVAVGGAGAFFLSGGDSAPAVSVAEPAGAATADMSAAPVDAAAALKALSAAPAVPAEHPAAVRAPTATAVALVRPELSLEEGFRPFLTTYCGDCHGPDYAEADLDVASLASADEVRGDREKWERILSIIQVGAMPPADMEQPSAEERAAAVAWLDRALHDVNCQVVNDPGRVTVRRLNRAEYDNTVRDLLGIEVKLADDFPSDDVGNGFDNQGEVLTLPPLLLEKYLDAAETASKAAIVGDLASLLTQSKGNETDESVDDIARTFTFPAEGDYTIRVTARAKQAGRDRAQYAVTLADIPLAKKITIKGDEPETFERTVPVKKGDYEIRVKFLNDFYQPDSPKGKLDRNLYLHTIEVVGPLGTAPPALPAPHAAIVVATPETAGSVGAAARAIFRPFATKAFRRPATELEVDRLAALVSNAAADGRTFEQAVQLGVQAVLVSPHFLFRIEADPDDARPGEAARLGDYELASRLSYFLWSSMPDGELLDLAAENRLHEPSVLDSQIERMLADGRSAALIDGFFGQWLNLRMLNDVQPDGRQFRPFWNDKLREAFREETDRLCEAVVRENLDVRTFLTADFTFVNPRLAEFYGVPWDGKSGEAMAEFYADGLPDYIKRDGRKLRKESGRRTFPYADEDEWVRVNLPETRRGVLTHGSILALTSNPTATSPVKRGKWILDNVLGTPPPPAPPNVPALEATQEANQDLSLREALAKHREDPSCASCHAVMDPLGFAFEHFDAVGRWREKDGRFEVDASGELPDGRTFAGAVELTAILESKGEQFAAHLTRQLMTYALGRGLEWYDRCAVDAVVAAAETDDLRFRSLVRGIVLSDPFQKRRAAELASN